VRISPQRAQRTRRTALTSAECACQGSLSPQRARRTQRTAEVGFGTAAHARQAYFGPNGAAGCSRGWSGAAAQRPDAEPVGGKRVPYPLLLAYPHSSRPGGAKEIPPPLPGRVHRLRTWPTGCAPPAMRRAALHPRLHAAAPAGAWKNAEAGGVASRPLAARRKDGKAACPLFPGGAVESRGGRAGRPLARADGGRRGGAA